MPALNLFDSDWAELAAAPALRPIADRLERACSAALARGEPESDIGLLELVGDEGELMGLCWLLDGLPPGLASLCVRDAEGRIREGLAALGDGGAQEGRMFCRLRPAVLAPVAQGLPDIVG